MGPAPKKSTDPYTPNLLDRGLIAAYKGINSVVPWHKLPSFLGTLNLAAYRAELRQYNLHDVYPSADYQGTPGDPHMNSEFQATRNSDGLFNDLNEPKMGCVGMRFGRNVPRKYTKKPTEEEIMTPSPRIVSAELLQRDKFKPATTLNLLAAAWIQFQVHDWFQHSNSTTEKYEVPLEKGDSWEGGKKMTVEHTQADKPLDKTDMACPAYANQNTHWWDGSQIYGNSEERTKQLRGSSTNGKLTVDVENTTTFLPSDENGNPVTGFVTNWWVGLEILHTLFVMEHNSICDELAKSYPDWSSEKLFDTARLINCALMAKIHTVEWTPGILAHPTLQISMNANWWGILGEKLYKLIGRVGSSESISGIPGSVAEQHGAPYSLTEEFVSVYRLHPLIPDDIAFFQAKTGEHKKTYSIHDVVFDKARAPLKESKLEFEDLFYSFGINYPGAITLNNTPSFLRDLHTPDGRHLDMGVIDILRDRERGVPRYNEFRRLFHMKPAPDFLTLTGGNKEVAEKLDKIYEGDIDKVDLLVGCLSEPLPKGFGFSDTAFRVFILMASRRLKSDRFIATEWNEKTYSKVGMNWVQNQGMKDVLLRHFPALAPALKDVKNPFAPWTKVGSSSEYKGKETNANV